MATKNIDIEEVRKDLVLLAHQFGHIFNASSFNGNPSEITLSDDGKTVHAEFSCTLGIMPAKPLELRPEIHYNNKGTSAAKIKTVGEPIPAELKNTPEGSTASSNTARWIANCREEIGRVSPSATFSVYLGDYREGEDFLGSVATPEAFRQYHAKLVLDGVDLKKLRNAANSGIQKDTDNIINAAEALFFVAGGFSGENLPLTDDPEQIFPDKHDKKREIVWELPSKKNITQLRALKEEAQKWENLGVKVSVDGLDKKTAKIHLELPNEYQLSALNDALVQAMQKKLKALITTGGDRTKIDVHSVGRESSVSIVLYNPTEAEKKRITDLKAALKEQLLPDNVKLEQGEAGIRLRLNIRHLDVPALFSGVSQAKGTQTGIGG